MSTRQEKAGYTYTSILTNWAIHIAPLSDRDRVAFSELRPGLMPAVLTGQVVDDKAERFPSGSAMMTSLLVGFDFQSMSCISASGSTYQLVGRGDIQRSGIPSDYSQAVGETILRNRDVLSITGE